MKRIIKTLALCLMVITSVAMIPTKVYATGEANPRITVENYSISGDEITPGEEFELTLKLRNTSIFYDTYSVLAQVCDETGSIYPVYGMSDQIYVERVYARNTWDITFKLQAAKEINTTVFPIKIHITYNDNKFFDKQINDTYLYLPVKVNGDLNITNVSIPQNTEIDTKARVAIDYENNGIGTLKNIKMNVSGDTGFEEYTTNLYSLNGGSKGNTEIFVDCNRLGEIPITVSFTYEDQNDVSYETAPITYKINVIPQNGNTENDVVVVNGGVSILTFIILAAIIVIIIIILITINNKKRR